MEETIIQRIIRIAGGEILGYAIIVLIMFLVVVLILAILHIAEFFN